MRDECLVLCGGVRSPNPNKKTGKVIPLNLSGHNPNITLKITDLSEKLVKSIPALFIDLLEIASYIYCADQAVSRGGSGVANMGADWRRQFHFVIPVREIDVWKQPAVTAALQNTLSFVSDDDYRFTFSKSKTPVQSQQYFEYDKNYEKGLKPAEVALFSGGLDSLAGCLSAMETKKGKVAFITHRSNPKTAGWQKDLAEELIKPLPQNEKPLHIPVWVHKDGERSHEYTQRARSFLYASLAATVAHLFKLNGFKFYENGIISINLPISAQVIGARATRTTHPQTLKGYSELFSLLMKKKFTVENPFMWKTKAEVVEIAKKFRPDLIRRTRSCTRTHESTNLHTHCGACSQCIDRRFAVLASQSEAHDPAEMYAIDLLTGKRKEGVDRTMADSYTRTAIEVLEMSDIDFFSRFGEATRAIRNLPGTADQAGQQILDLYKRHAKEVTDVLTAALQSNADNIIKNKLPESCLLMLAGWRPKTPTQTLVHSDDFRNIKYDSKEWSLTPNQSRAAQRLIESLRNGTPEIGQDTILEELGVSTKRLRDVFKGSSAWNVLIVRGKTKGTYRINPQFSQ